MKGALVKRCTKWTLGHAANLIEEHAVYKYLDVSTRFNSIIDKLKPNHEIDTKWCRWMSNIDLWLRTQIQDRNKIKQRISNSSSRKQRELHCSLDWGAERGIHILWNENLSQKERILHNYVFGGLFSLTCPKLWICKGYGGILSFNTRVLTNI